MFEAIDGRRDAAVTKDLFVGNVLVVAVDGTVGIVLIVVGLRVVVVVSG